MQTNRQKTSIGRRQKSLKSTSNSYQPPHPDFSGRHNESRQIARKQSEQSIEEISVFPIPLYLTGERKFTQTPSSSICVIFFDTDGQLNNPIASLLNNIEGFFLGGHFLNGHNLLEQVKDIQPELVIIDVKLSDMCSIAAVRMIHAEFPKIQIVVAAKSDEEDAILHSICAGATGYILKNSPMVNLLETFKALQRGNVLISGSMLRRIINQLHLQNKTAGINTFQLTTREQQVMHQMLDGASYKMIAARLGIRYHTAHNHVRRIYCKLKVNSMCEAVSVFLKGKIHE